MFRIWLFCLLILLVARDGLAKKPCKANEHWVNGHRRRAYLRADGTHVKASYVNAHCRKNQVGYDYWHPRLKNQIPEKLLKQHGQSKNWTEEELERVLDALAEIPEMLWKDIDGRQGSFGVSQFRSIGREKYFFVRRSV